MNTVYYVVERRCMRCYGVWYESSYLPRNDTLVAYSRAVTEWREGCGVCGGSGKTLCCRGWNTECPDGSMLVMGEVGV